MNTETTNYRSAKIEGRTAVEDSDGTLTVFQGLEIIAIHTVTDLTPGDVWELIHAAEVPAPVKAPKMQLSKRFAQDWYRQGGHTARESDRFQNHTRAINGKKFDFTRIAWRDGGTTVRVTPHNSTEILHEWIS